MKINIEIKWLTKTRLIGILLAALIVLGAGYGIYRATRIVPPSYLSMSDKLVYKIVEKNIDLIARNAYEWASWAPEKFEERINESVALWGTEEDQQEKLRNKINAFSGSKVKTGKREDKKIQKIYSKIYDIKNPAHNDIKTIKQTTWPQCVNYWAKGAVSNITPYDDIYAKYKIINNFTNRVMLDSPSFDAAVEMLAQGVEPKPLTTKDLYMQEICDSKYRDDEYGFWKHGYNTRQNYLPDVFKEEFAKQHKNYAPLFTAYINHLEGKGPALSESDYKKLKVLRKDLYKLFLKHMVTTHSFDTKLDKEIEKEVHQPATKFFEDPSFSDIYARYIGNKFKNLSYNQYWNWGYHTHEVFPWGFRMAVNREVWKMLGADQRKREIVALTKEEEQKVDLFLEALNKRDL